MKKKVLFVASLLLATVAFSQDGLTSKKGEAYLPEAGDWALGFDGTPFLDYAGNLFNGTQDNSVNATWIGSTEGSTDFTIVGKYFKDENTAYRAKLRIGFGTTSQDNLVDTNGTGFGGPIYITNTSSTSEFNLTLGGGIEKRRGNTRIQGFYGAEALISFGTSSTSEDYGLALSATNPTSRVTETSAGSSFTFSTRAFVGVEWFVAPKVSVAAEYGWGLAFNTTGSGSSTSESFGLASATATTATVNESVTETGGNSSFGIDTDNNGGVITIMFHF